MLTPVAYVLYILPLAIANSLDSQLTKRNAVLGVGVCKVIPTIAKLLNTTPKTVEFMIDYSPMS